MSAFRNILYIDINLMCYPNEERLSNLKAGDNSFCDALYIMLDRSKIQCLEYEGPIDPTLL